MFRARYSHPRAVKPVLGGARVDVLESSSYRLTSHFLLSHRLGSLSGPFIGFFRSYFIFPRRGVIASLLQAYLIFHLPAHGYE